MRGEFRDAETSLAGSVLLWMLEECLFKMMCLQERARSVGSQLSLELLERCFKRGKLCFGVDSLKGKEGT